MRTLRHSALLGCAIAALGAVIVVAACRSSEAPSAGDAGDGAPTCTTLFGAPNEHTGLGPDMCRPQCGCGADAFVPPTYDAAFIQSLVDDWQLVTPYAPVTADPYADGGATPPDDPPGTVCAVLEGASDAGTPRPYTLVTYPAQADALAAGARVTHFGHCGVCSTLANLAVYLRNDDLVAPVRSCGVQSSTDGGNADLACLQAMGFDLPCAQIWAYNTAHTRDVCIAPCIANVTAPYNEPDGALNACLQCDEDQSGPVFKAVAGRTRRNSGVPNSICRPCSEVQPLVHAY